ncbi:MAG TPA: CBS domain-containing protein [Phenylobacterium sp.]|uniref:CBS domain-containing protein n=1 Tax=Phenylobacterium sp. TaxID=1871053 RepID=UPI002D079AD3|nr:CBS domain-containing protein [Phenylobacterium sp.]HSV01997.1 CBS domain-containing protein [Phenylobacterium sp.]
MNISECMTRDVELARPDMSLREAAKLMAECDCGAVPVGDNDRLVGMVTDRDMAIRGLAQGKGPDTRVSEVMSREIRYCFDDDDADDVLEMMGEQQIRRMPVLNRDKRLVGIVSLGDLSREHEPRRAGEALSGISREGGQHSQTAH